MGFRSIGAEIAREAIYTLRGLLSMLKWRSLAKCDEIKLELGSGAKAGSDGWTTVDLAGADLFRDLRRGLPLAKESVGAVYMSHLLEHISNEQQQIFLQECHRVLEVGGTLSVAVPDARRYIDAYLTGTSFRASNNYFEPARVDTGSAIDELNYIAYLGGHHAYLFDSENLQNILLKAGFSHVESRDFDPLLDSIERHFESIYVIATK